MNYEIVRCPKCQMLFEKSYRAKTDLCKGCYKKNRREYLRLKAREYRLKQTLELEKSLGTACVICGSQENLVFHEIHGLNHQKIRGYGMLSYILKNKRDFVRLCKKHHSLVHFVASNVKSEWEVKKFGEIAFEIVKSKYTH